MLEPANEKPVISESTNQNTEVQTKRREDSVSTVDVSEETFVDSFLIENVDASSSNLIETSEVDSTVAETTLDEDDDQEHGNKDEDGQRSIISEAVDLSNLVNFGEVVTEHLPVENEDDVTEVDEIDVVTEALSSPPVRLCYN